MTTVSGRPIVAGVLAIGALLAAPAHTRAQDTSSAVVSATAAMAAGSARLTCGGCEGGRTRAPSGYLRLGRVVASGLILSGEVDAWSKSEEWVLFDSSGASSKGTARFTIATLDAVAQWHPLPANGFFVDAGIGIGRYQVSSKSRDVGGFRAYSYSLGYQAGVGYDIPLTSHVSLTPSAKVFGFTEARMDGVDGKASANVEQIGLGLTLH